MARKRRQIMTALPSDKFRDPSKSILYYCSLLLISLRKQLEIILPSTKHLEQESCKKDNQNTEKPKYLVERKTLHVKDSEREKKSLTPLLRNSGRKPLGDGKNL